jgi:outer membrane protein OmpA-like peptidoglycan-associated protein
MRFLLSVCTSFFFFTTNLLAQNLVPNPGFEELTSCPVDISVDSTGIAKAKYWFTTDKKNTPDLYNECTRKGEHYTMLGTQNTPARSGKGYAGIWCFSERLEVRLKSPLVKNKMYRVQIYVYHDDSTGQVHFYYPGFYFCFSKIVIIKKYIEDSLINKKVIRIVKSDSIEANRSKWQLFSAYYTARGGENYFAFGGLNSSKVIDKIYDEEYHHTIKYYYPYYYIDDVSVEEDTTVSTSAPLAFQGKLVSGEILTLKNIFFETSKANLLSTSNKELDVLAKALQNNLLVSLNIFGYTDSKGNEASNIELSTKRAEAVRNYLVSKGIALKRFNCKGFGSANAVADNKTEEGRKSNRRVEIEVTGTH